MLALSYIAPFLFEMPWLSNLLSLEVGNLFCVCLFVCVRLVVSGGRQLARLARLASAFAFCLNLTVAPVRSLYPGKKCVRVCV